jgi:hypothetical protein
VLFLGGDPGVADQHGGSRNSARARHSKKTVSRMDFENGRPEAIGLGLRRSAAVLKNLLFRETPMARRCTLTEASGPCEVLSRLPSRYPIYHRVLRKHAKAAGIDGKSFGPHALRATAATGTPGSQSNSQRIGPIAAVQISRSLYTPFS